MSSHNPVGRAWNRDELERLAELAVKYGILVISDEIHSDLVLFGKQHIPLASLGKEISDLTITCVAPSKTFNLAGLYTSAVIATNPELRKGYERILDVVHVGGDNILGQVALEAAYTHGDEWLEQLKDYLEKNYIMLSELLCRFGAGNYCFPPGGHLPGMAGSFLSGQEGYGTEIVYYQPGQTGTK